MSRQTMLDSLPPQSLPEAWEDWSEGLSKRHRPAPAWSLLEEGKTPLVWGLDLDEGLAEWLRQMARVARGKKTTLDLAAEAKAWIAAEFTASSTEAALRRSLEALGWAYALPALAEKLEGVVWWKLWHELVSTAAEPHPTLEMTAAPLAYQLAAGELPLVLAYQFPELPACQQLAELSHEAFSLSLEELLDGEGLPKAGHLTFVRPLLATWTRAAALCDSKGAGSKAPWSEVAELQFHWLVRQALRLTLADGSQVLEGGSSGDSKGTRELFDAALRLGGDSADGRATEAVFEGKHQKDAGKKGRGKIGGRGKLIDPSVHSEWSEVSVLRTAWQRETSVFALRHDRPAMGLDFRVGGEPIFPGDWHTEVRLNGHPLAFEGPWEVVCWQNDLDGTYVEFLADLASGVKLGRQIFLGRRDEFLFVADAVLAAEAEPAHGSNGSGHAGPRLEYRGRFPLAADVSVDAAEKTRELMLSAGRERIRAVPLGLGEWRTDRRYGRLEVTEAGGSRVLEISQHSPGSSLYVPMFFDLKRKRSKTFVTWRHLTVAQQRSILHSDVAVGYRVKVDMQQWFVYRSLTRPANRTVLGQNLVSEFLLARFGEDGETQTLVEIEG